jgi:hypothetical protein
MSEKTIGEMTSRQMLDAADQALAEVFRRLASGELDQSGRYYTDEELAAGAATGTEQTPEDPARAGASKGQRAARPR